LQRVLPSGEIGKLDHNDIVRVRLPERQSIFDTRAARLRQLAADSPVADYLNLMADLADAQQVLLNTCHIPGADAQQIDRAQAHGMPPLQAVGWQRDPLWKALLRQLALHIEDLPDIPLEAMEVCQELRRKLEDDPQSIEAMADAILE